MSREINEKEKIYNWACQNNSADITRQIFTPIDTKVDSYFEKRIGTKNYVYEYKFQKLPELKSKLESMWAGEDYMDQIMMTVLISAFKNGIAVHETKDQESVRQATDVNEISPYIYNF